MCCVLIPSIRYIRNSLYPVCVKSGVGCVHNLLASSFKLLHDRDLGCEVTYFIVKIIYQSNYQLPITWTTGKDAITELLGTGKRFPLLFQSYLFISRPFNENFDFLKHFPYDSNDTFYSHPTPNHGPMSAKALKSYRWDLRNTAKKVQK